MNCNYCGCEADNLVEFNGKLACSKCLKSYKKNTENKPQIKTSLKITENKFVISGIDIPFNDLVVIQIKIVLAMLPALFFLTLLGFALTYIFSIIFN